MILFPHAKINLGLNVVRRRPDGYHDIESVMVPIPICDALEAVVDDGLPNGQLVFTRSGLAVPGAVEDDLCWKAARGVIGTRALPGVRMHLHKNIPLGAGLGGGSSDAAHVIRLLDDLFKLEMLAEEKSVLAESLGSDVPYFVAGGAQLAEGRGEILRPVQIHLSGLWLLLVNPGVHVSTADAYRNCVPSERSGALAGMIEGLPLEEWQDTVVNDLEAYVMEAFPTVASIRQMIIGAGAVYTAMSGSGSTVFGLFRQEPARMEWPEHHRVWCLRL